MPRYNRKQKITLRPLMENISERVQSADGRHRRTLVKYSVILFIVFVVYSFFAGPYGFFRINRLSDRHDELQAENRALLVSLIDSDIARQRLIDDPAYIEFIARSKYLLAKPGETIIRVQRPGAIR